MTIVGEANDKRVSVTSTDAVRQLAATRHRGQRVSVAGRENIAIFCAEGDPAACHRTWDIGASLLVRYGVIARSILRDGREEDVTDTLRRVPPANISACIADQVSHALSGEVRLDSI